TVTTGRTSTTARATVPSTVTRSGPKHLAFTGAEPIVVGLGGASLMLLGFVLHRRRRTDRPAA
ncbi:MAG: LPXTG cell wall anchor domain-containing protein, partial [Solirubrobacterales bacterium]|nr:LPXTG cell wall anchor domain-containing protein [Solirubrobacterales bacterium]